MKKIIILTLLGMSIYTAEAQTPKCIDFTNYTNADLVNWVGFYVAPTAIKTDATHGQYLELTDDQGGSYVVNDTEFNGNWITLSGGNSCFCFDYNVNWDASVSTPPTKAPHIGIYTGGSAANSNVYIVGRVRAVFVGNSTNPDITNNVWRKFCMPVGLSANGQLPSNSFGTWIVFPANSTVALTGAAACTAWDNLIQHVTGAYFNTDYNSSPSEKIKLDNFCWACAPNVATCACSSFVQFTQAPFVINPDGKKISASSCDRSLAAPLDIYTTYQFSTAFQTYNAGGCTTEYSAVIYDSGNHVIASQSGTNAAVPLLHAFSQAGDYSIVYTLKVNGVVCETCTMLFTISASTPCCSNKFPVWTDIPVPQSYPFAAGTYSVEDFVVHGANSIPITELKVTVEDFELISKYEDCIKCYNPPATMGSILGGSIGTGSNKLTLQVQPYGTGNLLTENNNELVWKNANGATLSSGDRIRLVYILPAESEIPCCVDSAKICVRISYRDINCGYCEVHNCTIVPLRPKGANTTLPTLQLLFYNARGIFQPGKAPGF